MAEYGRRPITRTVHQDSLANALSGFGGRQDRTMFSEYLRSHMRDDHELTSIYTGGDSVVGIQEPIHNGTDLGATGGLVGSTVRLEAGVLT